MVTFLDRIVAACSGMASTFYFMSACLAWYRVIGRKGPLPLMESVMLDRAVAWSGISILLGLISVLKLTDAEWESFRVDIIRIISCLAIFIAGLMSVHVMTCMKFGYKILLVFTIIPVTIGLILFFL